ncbi:MAG: MMPL family transporter, partial [Rhizobiales bacterium]|nr:MMPL family transporter [Hyphomicrobiales bacterium]
MNQQSLEKRGQEQRIAVLGSRIAAGCVHRPLLIICMFLVAAALSAVLAMSYLKVDTDPSLMISNDLPSSSAYQRFMGQFPALQETFLFIVDAEDGTKARAAAGKIADQMRPRTDLFSHVFAPGSGPFFEKYGVLYLPEPEVQKLADDIKKMAPLFNAMTLQHDLAGLDDLFKQITPVVEIGRAPDDVAKLLNQIAATVDSGRSGNPTPLDWATIGDAAPAAKQTRWFVFAKPVLDYTALDAAAAPLAEARRLMAEASAANSGVRVQLTGDAALNAEEFETVTQGALLAGVTSFGLVTATVLIGLPALWLVVPALALIVLGLLITAGFAAVSIGYLNMISVAFAVLYIGLGVDYAVHVVLRFAEERAQGQDRKSAAIAAVRATVTPLALCTLTTSLAFLTFTLTDFVGMAQLGIISAAGVTVAFLASTTLIPAILCLLPVPQEKLARKFATLKPKETSPSPGSSSVLRRSATITLVVLAGFSIFLLPQARFDSDPINLKDPKSPGMIAFNDLAKSMSGEVYAVHLVAKPGKAFDATMQTFKALPEVADVRSIASVIPPDQDRKIALLNELALAIPAEILPSSAMTDPERADYLASILASVQQMTASEQAPPRIAEAARRLENALQGFLNERGQKKGALSALEEALVGRFPEFFKQVRQFATLDRVGVDNLAAGFKERYVAADGRWRMEILPKEDMRAAHNLEHFVDVTTAANPQVTGAPVDIKEAADVVAHAILLTYGAAFTIVVLTLYPVLRRVW